MIIESILIAVTLLLLFSGMFLGYGLGRTKGERNGYHRGFAEGVDFARGLRRKQKGRPLYDHLKLVRSDDTPKAS